MTTPRSLIPLLVLLAAPVLCTGCGGSSGSSDEERTTLDVWSVNVNPSERMALMLAPREATAEIFVAALPADIQQIAEKLKQSAELDPHAFLQLMRDGASGGPPPYDVRLGITADEYDLLVNHARHELQKKSDAPIKIVKVSPERITITGLPDLKELSFEPSVQTVVTQYGEVARPALIEPSTPQSLIGSMGGFRWRREVLGDELVRFQIPEILLGQSPEGSVWIKVTIIDTLDNRRLADYFARFAGPPK